MSVVAMLRKKKTEISDSSDRETEITEQELVATPAVASECDQRLLSQRVDVSAVETELRALAVDADFNSWLTAKRLSVSIVE